MTARRVASVWVAIAVTDPERNGPEESFREVADGRVYVRREDAVAAAQRTGLPFYEKTPRRVEGQWCTVDSYPLVAPSKRRRRRRV